MGVLNRSELRQRSENPVRKRFQTRGHVIDWLQPFYSLLPLCPPVR